MLNKKLFAISLVICMSGFNTGFANLTISDLVTPKEPAYRVGISEIPENQYIEAKENTIKEEITAQIRDINSSNTDISYADLSLKRISKEISQDLAYDEQEMVADLTLLWQGAAMQSDTINFALYKLANPDADKPNKSTVKNMLKTIASMSTLVGAGMANPLLAGTSLIGGNVLDIMSQDTKALNYKYTRVSDADMIILIRKVEDLQQNAVNLYYDYMSSKKQLELATKIVKERQKRFELAQKNNAAREIIVVSDAYFRAAVDRQKSARSEFLSKRAALEQFVGNEAFTQFEEELVQRENMNKNAKNEEEKENYIQTIQNVENYTNNLNTNSKTDNIENPHEELNNASEPSSDNIINFETQDDDLLASREDKYSTKGLIFLHNTENTIEQEPVTEEQNVNEEKNKKKSKTKKSRKKDDGISVQTVNSEQEIQPQIQNSQSKPNTLNGIELLPLNELKAPNYYKNGSIFNEQY